MRSCGLALLAAIAAACSNRPPEPATDGGYSELDAGGPRVCTTGCLSTEWRWDRLVRGSGISLDAMAISADGTRIAVTGTFRGDVDLGSSVERTEQPIASYVMLLDAEGSALWQRVVPAVVEAIAIDRDGGVAVAGRFWETVDLGGGPQSARGESDGFVGRYDARGAFEWSVVVGGPSADAARAIAIDDEGGVVVAGAFSDTADFGLGLRTSAGGRDAFVLGLDARGHPRWDDVIGTALEDGTTALTAAGAGVAWAGTARGDVDLGSGPVGTRFEIGAFVRRYDRAGAALWSRIVFSRGEWPVRIAVTGLALDGAGRLAVAGEHDGTTNFGGGLRTVLHGAFVAVYGADGSHHWDDGIDNTGTGSVAFAADGGVSLAAVALPWSNPLELWGEGRPLIGDRDVLLLRYDAGGCPRYARIFGGRDADEPRAVGNAARRVVVAGMFRGEARFGGPAVVGGPVTTGFVTALDESDACCQAGGAPCGDGCCTDATCVEGECRAFGCVPGTCD